MSPFVEVLNLQLEFWRKRAREASPWAARLSLGFVRTCSSARGELHEAKLQNDVQLLATVLCGGERQGTIARLFWRLE
jgi:hypothetical protein